ncbi:hypothetical protein B0I26_1205 [Anoxybacillus vitaminiphilus]|uniref:Uncharacterized protein n=1 Tax=Paranoxybacillus vitaminiphilus TaxID=581036 RepID=A0A327Y3D0_9BACL|nr:hypothetical protein B0I26_1205 [Anoxybacillus vitaminiphilus]
MLNSVGHTSSDINNLEAVSKTKGQILQSQIYMVYHVL